MPTHNSILITLDNSLQVYTRAGSGHSARLEYTLTGERYLELSEKMEAVWGAEIAPRLPAKIYLVLGPRAGFTDSRMVYLWLKSSALFEGTEFCVHAASVVLRLEDYTGAELDEYLGPIAAADNQELVYSRAPRIGRR